MVLKWHYCCCQLFFYQDICIHLYAQPLHEAHQHTKRISMRFGSILKWFSASFRIAYVSSWYRIVHCCWMGTWTEQVEKLDKFACIKFTAFAKNLPFSSKTRSVAICNTAHSLTCFKFQSFLLLCEYLTRSMHSHTYAAQVLRVRTNVSNTFMYRGIDAMHTKSVCSIIVSIYLFPHLFQYDVCRSICHHSSEPGIVYGVSDHLVMMTKPSAESRMYVYSVCIEWIFERKPRLGSMLSKVVRTHIEGSR